MMRNNITQLAMRRAVSFGMSLVAVSAIGSAVAQSPVATHVVGQEALTNRFAPPVSETDFRLSDRQQFKDYFLDDRATDCGDRRSRCRLKNV